jgi:Brp/Blh family beta-carotene 15,15'-monooxygenase
MLAFYQLTWGEIPMSWQIGYFAILIGATGIPHGALDHLIAKANAEQENKTFTISRFLLRYVTVIVLYGFCWIKLPGISLVIFLIISAWHFGETDLHAANNILLWQVCRFLWGTLVLLIILLTHPEQTSAIVLRISGQSATVNNLLSFFVTNGFIICVGLFIICSTFLLLVHKKAKWNFNSGVIFNLLLILGLTAYLPLLPAFALYFGGWHAIRSFEIIFTYLHSRNETIAITPVAMWKNALPMTFLAAFGFVFMAFIWKGTGLNMDPLPFVFIFLSVITLPHLDVMDKLISIKGENPTKKTQN